MQSKLLLNSCLLYDSVICINSKEEAEKIYKTYSGNKRAKVRALAQEIAKEMEA